VRIQTKTNKEEQTNLFICILGDSTVSGKSDAIRPLLTSGLLKEASSKIEDFVLISGNIQDTVQGVVEALVDRVTMQRPGKATCGGIEINLPQLFQSKTISLVTISTEAGPYFNSTGADKSNARGKEVSAFHRNSYDSDIIEVPLTKAARSKTGFDLDAIRAMCTLILGLTSQEFDEVKGDTSAANGHLPRFVFVGVDESFEGLPYIDYAEAQPTVSKEEILKAVEKFASNLKESPHVVRFNSNSPVVQNLNNEFVKARDFTVDINDTTRRASIRGIVNLYRVAGLIAGCELMESVSDEVITALKDIFENEIMPLSIESQTGGTYLEKRILSLIQDIHDREGRDPSRWDIQQHITPRSRKVFVETLTALVQSGVVVCYKEDILTKEMITFEKPVYGGKFVLTDYLKDNEEGAK
jgi:hypothetical protein